MLFPLDGPPDEDTIRLRAVFVPRGAAVPSEMLQGMTDTVRIPAQFLPDTDSAPPRPESPETTSQSDTAAS